MGSNISASKAFPATRKDAATARVLLVEDDPSIARVLKTTLAAGTFDVLHAERGTDAFEILLSNTVDLVLLDLRLPDMHGLDILARIQGLKPAPATVVITGESSVDTAVAAMRAGAVDFIPKPFSPARVLKAVAAALETDAVKRGLSSGQTGTGSAARSQAEDGTETSGFRGLIGVSPAMQAVNRMIAKVAVSPRASVFITGESGTGKDVVAQAIHDASPRAERPFVALNCGAIPKDLMESELFGHVKGAFTGATADRPGAARRAHGGTLFLDELGEMDINLQSKLLRFIQTGDVQAVGAGNHTPVDVRFVCATNRDPMDAVAQNRLREDLFYRLNVLPLHLPPLRERGSDVLLVARHFLRQFAREEGKRFTDFDPETADQLLAHEWPGNVRELQNVVRRAVVLHDGVTVSPDMIAGALISSRAGGRRFGNSGAGGGVFGGAVAPTPLPFRDAFGRTTTDDGEIRPLWLLEKEAIEHAVEACQGNVVAAAARLGINPSTIYRKRQGWAKAPLDAA